MLIKLFNDWDKANEDLRGLEKQFINRHCPYAPGELCGNWCPHFSLLPNNSVQFTCGTRRHLVEYVEVVE